MNEKKVSVVLPAYNEELTIVDTILAFIDEIPNAEIIVVNNNSSDKTVEKVESLIDKHPEFNIVLLQEFRQGKGFAVRKAFLESDSDVVVISDADLTYPANMVKELIAPILDSEADMVIGDRLSNGSYGSENKRAFHGLGNKIVPTLINKMFRANVTDVMTGYRAFSRRFIKTYPVLSKGFEIETEMTLHSLDKRMAIKEIPINYIDRPEGSESKLNTFSDGFKVLYTIFQIFKYYKPFSFFGLIALMFFVSGLGVGLPVILEFLNTGYIYAIPKAILATGLMVISILLFSVGLILDSLARNHRFDFELYLLNHNSSYEKE